MYSKHFSQRTGLIISSILLIAVFFGCDTNRVTTPDDANDIELKPSPPLYVRYFFTAEATYEDIVVTDSKLRFTYFKDTNGKCANWLQQRPCWTLEDLTTEEATLSEDDVQDLRDLINQSKFMNLESVYGGAEPDQRYYPETLEVKLGETEQKVTYQSFPEAAPMPEAFKKVRDKLFEIVNSKFKREQ